MILKKNKAKMVFLPILKNNTYNNILKFKILELINKKIVKKSMKK